MIQQVHENKWQNTCRLLQTWKFTQWQFFFKFIGEGGLSYGTCAQSQLIFFMYNKNMLKWKYFKYIPQQSNLLTMVTLMTSCMACRSILSQGWKSWDVCASRFSGFLQSVMLSTALEAGLLDELIVTGFDTATINIQLNSFSKSNTYESRHCKFCFICFYNMHALRLKTTKIWKEKFHQHVDRKILSIIFQYNIIFL